MPTLVWSEALALHEPRIDDTHREFVTALAALENAAPGAATHAALRALREHCEAHFAQEDRWLADLGVDADNCHSRQHAEVLELVREVERRDAIEPRPVLVASLVQALAQWFPNHAGAADAGLAAALESRDDRAPRPVAPQNKTTEEQLPP